MSSVINDTNLPKCFINKIVSPTNDDGITVVRSGIQSMADITKWIKEFGQNTNTHWIVAKCVSEGQRIVCSKQYVCQYNSSRKAKEKSRGIAKDSLCQAKINFQVKINTSYTRSNDIHIREGLCGVIIIKSKHSHPIEPEDTMRLVALNSPLKDTFFGYFNMGLGISESLKHHQHKLDLLENNNKMEHYVVYGKVNPTERTARYWHDQWKKLENLKRRTDIALCKATTSRTFQNPPLSPLPSTLLPPSLQSPHTYYQPRSPNNIRKSSVQTEYVEQDNLNIDEDHKEDVQCLINQTNGDRIQSIASPQNLLQFDSNTHLLDVKEHPHSKFVDSGGKATLSPTSGLDNCDGSSTISQTLTTRNEESIAFGEYVGLSLSRMDDYVRTVAIHRISKVIYEADMGMFDKESGGGDDKEKPKDSSSTLNTLPLATK